MLHLFCLLSIISFNDDKSEVNITTDGIYEFSPLIPSNIKKATFFGNITEFAKNSFNLYPYVEVIVMNLTSKSLIIGKKAFKHLKSLHTIKIPDNTIIIDDEAFSGCMALTQFDFPSSCRNVSSKCFWECSKLKFLNLTNVDNIAEGAFKECSSLSEIIFKKPLEIIQKETFASCSSLKKVTISNSITYIGDAAFFYCYNLDPFNLPDSLEYIGANAFCRINGFTEITVPPKIQSISAGCFYGMKNLKKINLNHVKVIESQALANCSNLDDINYGDSLTKIYLSGFEYSGLKGELNLPSTLSYFGEKCFKGISITSLIFNSDNVKLEDNAFEDCSSLESVTFKNDNVNIDSGVFASCSSLKQIKIPNNVKIIGKNLFYSCNELVNVQLPEHLEAINQQAFYKCEKLKSIRFPASLNKIGLKAFYSCSSLTEVYLPESLQMVGFECFASCGNLKFVHVISNVEFDVNVFSNCANFKEIIFNSSSINNITIPISDPKCVINIVNAGEEISFTGHSFQAINITCKIRKINSKKHVAFETFTYNGIYEIEGDLSDNIRIKCVNLNPEYKGKLFGIELSRYTKCGVNPKCGGKSPTVGILVALAILIIIGVIAAFFILRWRKNRMKGFSEIPSNI